MWKAHQKIFAWINHIFLQIKLGISEFRVSIKDNYWKPIKVLVFYWIIQILMFFVYVYFSMTCLGVLPKKSPSYTIGSINSQNIALGNGNMTRIHILRYIIYFKLTFAPLFILTLRVRVSWWGENGSRFLVRRSFLIFASVDEKINARLVTWSNFQTRFLWSAICFLVNSKSCGSTKLQ